MGKIDGKTAELSERANIIRLALLDYANRTLGREKSVAEELALTAPESFDAMPELIDALIAAEAALNKIRVCCHHTAWDATGPAVIAARAALAAATGAQQ